MTIPSPTLDALEKAVHFAHGLSYWLLRRELHKALVDIYVASELVTNGDEMAAMMLGGEFPRDWAEEALGERE